MRSENAPESHRDRCRLRSTPPFGVTLQRPEFVLYHPGAGVGR